MSRDAVAPVGATRELTPVTFPPREVFAGQARLLAARAERGLPIDGRSWANLERAYVDLVVDDLLETEPTR